MSTVAAKVFNCYEVQRTITCYLDVIDLKRLRLVNKTWMNAALISLKSKSHVILNSPFSLLNYIEFLHETGFSICFSNYKISIKSSDFKSIEEASALFHQFWELCSDSVKEMCLNAPWTCTFPLLKCICYVSSSTAVEQSTFVIYPLEKISLTIEDVERENDNWMPKEEENATEADKDSSLAVTSSLLNMSKVLLTSLNTLQLNVSIVLNTEKKVFPFTWRDFFHSCPKLCHLSIQSDYASVHFYHIVNVLLEQNMIMKTLKFGTRDQRLFSDDFLMKLAMLSTNKLETISFGFLPSVRHNSPLNTILMKSSSSLKQLTFLQIRTSNQAEIACFSGNDDCQFPNLISLRITKEFAPNLGFVRKMPKLKRLEIFRASTIGQHDNLSNPVTRTRTLPVMNFLTSLILELFVPTEDVWKLVKWFPNVQRLQMKASDVIARIIFMSWKNLRELYLVAEIIRDNNDIVRCTLTDEGITGISKEALQLIDESTSNNRAIPPRTIAYIGDLKHLEVCKLQTIPDYQSGLTDYSIYYGLNDLPNLASITCNIRYFVRSLPQHQPTLQTSSCSNEDKEQQDKKPPFSHFHSSIIIINIIIRSRGEEGTQSKK